MSRTSKYKTVVLDPPWNVRCNLNNKKFYRTGKKLPYQVMSDAEISNFPIDNFADKECDLFLWTTHTKLPIALSILKKWGFKYHVVLTWDKQGGVCINGFYRRTEFVVYGYRGKQCLNVGKGHYIPTLFSEKSKEHSRKPNVFYRLLVKRTREPRIDLFARKKHWGFDAWGDEVDESQRMLCEK